MKIFKFVKQFQKNTLIHPSEINFLNETEFKIDDNLLIELNSKIDNLNSKSNLPKLQVTQKDGYYFCLNNTMLFLFQNLEQKKRVEKIQCELISLDKVPEYLQSEMVLNYDYRSSESSDSCCSGCGNYNDTITTIISSNKNQLADRYSDLDANQQTTEQNYTTSLINKDNEDQSIHSSISSSELSDDFNQRDNVSNYSSLTCDFCNQTFSNSKLLSKHKLRKKHFVCACGDRFKNMMKLEIHKQNKAHWD